MDHVTYEVAGNTWAAAGALSKESIRQLRKLWAVTGAYASLKNSHVIGRPHTQPWVDTVVSETFKERFEAFDSSLFDFVEIENVWFRTDKCPPWDGKFYIATLMPLRPSYDLDHSDLLPSTDDLPPRFWGKYGSSGGKRMVRKSATEPTAMWRDTYTRQVHLTDEARAVIDEIGVPEWNYLPVEVNKDS